MNTNELNFEQELYSAISGLSLWGEGKASATEAGVLFQAENISAVEEFNAMGRVSLDVREETKRSVEFLTIDLVLAQNADPKLADKIIPKLYDVNLALKEGVFYLDDSNNLCYEVNFPVLRADLEASLKLFIAAYTDVMNYIDGVYPFLLRVMSHPEDSSFNEYIMAILESGEEQA